MRRFLHVSARPALQTSPSPALSAAAPLARHAVRFYAATRPLAYGRGRSSPGAPRLSFAERVARRAPKTAEMKHTAAELRREAEDYVRVEFTDEVDALARRWLLRARTAVLRLANPAAALEQLDVEILPKVKRPLLQLATVTKVTMRQLCVIAHTPQFTTALTHALQRHDRSMEVRQSGRRIYLMIDPITRQRRDETIDAVAAHKAGFQKGMKALRRRAINYVTGLGLSDEELVRELVAALEVQCRELEAEHAAEFDESSALMLVLLSTSMSAATAPIQVATQDPTPKVQQPKGAHSRRPPQVSAASAPSHDSCPVLYPAGHGLVNTGRKALVLYAFTSHPDLPERQVEVDNFQFFRGHGIMPPDTPTALFSSVDYVITTSKMDRSTPVGDHGVVQCASNANVKVFQAPSGPCDLCAYGRGIKALGGPEAVAKHYEYVFMFNSGVRGPLFTEAPAGPDDPPPVTWLDHAALGGESVYTGMLMTGTIGTATHRPYLTSFAFGFPTAVLMTMQPVLYAGCLEMTPTMPEQWEGLLTSFDADLHLDGDPKELIAKLKAILDNPSVLKSTPKGDRDAVARKIDEKVAAGVENHRAAAEKAYKILMAGTKNPPWSEKKRACVYRTEVQMLKTALGTKLPPEVGDSSSSSPLRRPRLTPHQKSLLSPVLSGYLHEGHYFGRSFFHNQTVVNMGHGMLLNEPGHLPMCALLFLKFGGMAWREKNINGLFALGMQMLTLAQAPQRITPPGINLAQVLQCPRQTAVEPLK